nr:AAA family ATPase [Ruegeria lacuscaerulensis]
MSRSRVSLTSWRDVTVKSEFTLLSKVERKEVEWLWEPLIPRGMMTILEGDPDVGKSYLAMHIASIVSQGGTLPNGAKLKSGKVLYFSQEDDPAYTIRPRVEDMGGDLDRVKVHTGDSIFDEAGMSVLKREVRRWKPDLIIVDPLVAYIDASTDFYKSNEVRPILRALTQIAEKGNCALLPIRHLVKTKTTKALYQGGGSMDFIAFVRSALRVAQHPDDLDRRVLVHFKHNLSQRGESLMYEIVKQGPGKRPRVEWKGTTGISIEDLHDGPGKQSSELDRAVSFLRQYLAKGPVAAKDVELQAEAKSLSKRTLDRAKEALSVKSEKEGKKWIWSLDDNSHE